MQWIWPVIVIPITLIAPESPWWLIRQGRLDDAEVAVKRLSSKSVANDDVAKKTVAMMQKTDLFEKKVETGTNIRDCLKHVALRRTEICIMVFVVQDFAVSPMSVTYLFEQLGLPTTQAYDASIGFSALGLIATLLAAFVLRYFGRRRTFTTGIGLLTIIQFIVAFLSLAPSYKTNRSYAWAQVALLSIAQVVYQLSIGPLTYTILTEVPSTKLKSATVGIAIAVDAMCGIVTNVATPYLLNPGEANAGGKTDFLWGGISIFSFLWCYYRLPETKNRTYEELDYLFEKRVSARKFESYVINEEELEHDLDE